MLSRSLKVLGKCAVAGMQKVRAQHHDGDVLDAVRTLATLRGPMVKMIQAFALFPELLPDGMQDIGDVVYAHVPPMGEAMLTCAMERYCGQEWMKPFSQFDCKARYAASFGQVHQAVLNDGTICAVKVQYPHASRCLQHDIHMMRRLMAHRYQGAFDLDNIVNDLEAKFREELDYNRERRWMQQFGVWVRRYDHLTIPQVVDHCSNAHVICMDWAQGVMLDSFLARASQDSKDRVAHTLFHFWMDTLCSHGVMHGDPHFGNYFFSAQGDVTLLDFGSVVEVSRDFLKSMCCLYKGLKSDNIPQTYDAYEAMGFRVRKREVFEHLNTWTRFVMQPLLKPGVKPIYCPQDTRIGKALFHDIMGKLSHACVYMPIEFLWFDRVVMSLGALIFLLKTQANWSEMFEQALDAV